MKQRWPSLSQSRRDFMKGLLAAGVAAKLETPLALFGSRRGMDETISKKIVWKHRVVSLARYKELQENIEKLKHEGKISRHPVFRSYIDPMKFEVPKDFSEAKSVIVLAVFNKMMKVNFLYNGRVYPIVIPSGYYDNGITEDDLKGLIRKDLVKDPGYRLERARRIHLKLLAVRSGLGRYGRNNICYVDGMGSYLALSAFYTDAPLGRDDWGEIAMMDACRDCEICSGACPTGIIGRENFVIDVGRCLPLYNEVPGEFPNWMLPSMHNSLMGCMRCQLLCPENEKIPDSSATLEDVAEEETRKILNGTPDENLLRSLSRKLKDFSPATSKEEFPVFTRNLKALIR